MIAALPDLEAPLAVLIVVAVAYAAVGCVREHRRDRAARVDEALEFGRVKWRRR